MSHRPYPKSHSLHYDAVVSRYFERLEAQGHDLSEWQMLQRSPGTILPTTLVLFAEHVGADLGELLSNGLGRNNTFDELDLAVRQHREGYRLGIVDTVA